MASFACLALCGNQVRAPASIVNLTHWLISTQALAWSQRVRNDVKYNSPMPVDRWLPGRFPAIACAWFLKAVTDTIDFSAEASFAGY